MTRVVYLQPFRSNKIETSIEGIKPESVALFSPSQTEPTSGSDFSKKCTRQRKPNIQTSGIGIRRSARLLKGKK